MHMLHPLLLHPAAVPAAPAAPPAAAPAVPPDAAPAAPAAPPVAAPESLTPGWVVYGKRRHAELPEEDVPPQLYPW
jgi:hypothetical protein